MLENVLLVSQSDISREGLSNLFAAEGFSVVATCREISDYDFAGDPAGKVIVLDNPNREKHLEMLESLKDELDDSVVVVLAETFDLNAMVEFFRAGVRGYIIKAQQAVPLIAAVKLAAMGQRVVPPDLLDVFDRRSAPVAAPMENTTELEGAQLSPREHDVLCCLMAGYSNKVIARELAVCEATVKVHVKAILRKLKVHNRTQAAMWASARGYSDAHLAWQTRSA